MAEHEKRKAARKLISRTGYKIGGHMTKRPDEIADKHEITEAVHEHESALHKGKPKTRLHLRDGGSCEGLAAGGRSDRKPRGAKSGKGKKGGTTVNVVIAHPHPKAVPVPVPVGAGAPPGGPAGPMPPPPDDGAPPMMGPGPGGPPMGAKNGGRIGLKSGGKAKGKFTVPMEDGAGGGLGRIAKAKAYGA